MLFEDLQFFYNLCNPDEALPPSDKRNVDLDSMGPKDALVRGQNWAGTLANIVRRAQGSVVNPVKGPAPSQPVCRIFTALPGSGKSTELLRLAEQLRKPAHSPRFLPVYIDAEEVLDLTSPVDVPDIRLATLLRVAQTVLREEGKDEADAAGEGMLTRFWKGFTGIDPTKAEVGVNLGVVSAKLVADMKANPTLRGQVRDHVAAQVTTFNESVNRELRDLNVRAQALGFAGIVVLFDSLEKLRGISSNWSAVLGSAERIFAHGAPYLRLPIHVIYTIPPAVFLRLNEPSLLFMPMIKLRDQLGTPFQPGIDAALALVKRRIPDAKMLAALFGAEHVDSRLRRLIEWSGGYPREIIRLLQTMMTEDEADYPLSEKTFLRLLSSAGDNYRRIISNVTVDWLARVAVDHVISIEDDSHRETVDQMLSNNIVLRYQNQSEWFDVHPAVREDRRVQAAIQRVPKTP